MNAPAKTLKSHVSGAWYEAGANFRPLVDPCSEETIAQVSSDGLDFAGALEFARTRGGAALRELSIAQRGELLQAMSKALHAEREALIDLSLVATGSTRKDSKFDLDGATGTLSYYAYLAAEQGERRLWIDGDGGQLGRSPRFWGEHVWMPREGVAIHINAFNFPAWGFAEKAACAILAGMPVITKPATSTAMVTERCIEIIVEANILPEGALSLICGSTGDLLDRLGPQDVLAFTGSADTALGLRSNPNLLKNSVPVNIEADSLNSAVLAGGVGPGDETWNLFLRDVEREITQKSGQKCTAVRRVFVPADHIDAIQEELGERLGAVVTGNPAEGSVNMGPLATAQQLEDAIAGVKKLTAEAKIVQGTGERVEGVGNPAGKGYFFAPTLLRADDGHAASVIHEHEVFAPVATLVPYDGTASEAATLVARGGGTLVSSVYGDDRDFLGEFIARSGAWSGRVYVGSTKVADQLPGSGIALPQMLHGGPGRAGGGAELGGRRGIEFYGQRLGVMGDRPLIERLTGIKS